MADQRLKVRRIRIHITHESRMLAEALSVRLKTLVPGAAVEGWGRSWEKYVTNVDSVADVVVIDNELGNGPPTPVKVRALVSRGVGVIVLGRSTQAEVIRRLAEAGAHAYVLAEEPAEVMAQAVTAASGRELYQSARVRGILLADAPHHVPELTTRELEVAAMYVSGAGASVAEAAERFEVSPETVRSHISHVRRKYAVEEGDSVSKMELRRRLLADGWIVT